MSIVGDFDQLGVTPETIKIVIRAGFLGENVDQIIAVIRQDPLGIFETLHTHGVFSHLVKLTADLFGDGLNLSGIAPGCDDEEIRERGDFAQIKHSNVGSFLRFGSAGGNEPRRS